MTAYFSKMNHSIKIVTFSVKPEVGNGLESEIVLSTKLMLLGIKTTVLEGGSEENLPLQFRGTFKLKEIGDAHSTLSAIVTEFSMKS